MTAASATSATKGWTLNTRKMRWIGIIAMGATWGATIATMLIQPHIQVYMTVWLATLLASLVGIATWMIGPDHGLLSQFRLKIATLRLGEAIAEEAAAHEARSTHEAAKLKSVA